MTADLAYPKCPVCGSTDACCWLTSIKGWRRRIAWHRERKVYDPRRVRCDDCGAEVGEPCRTCGDVPLSREHSARRRAHRAELLKSYERFDNVGF